MKQIWEISAEHKEGFLGGHLVCGDRLLLRHYDGEGLLCLGTETGDEAWTMSDAAQYFGKRVYSSRDSILLTGLDCWLRLDSNTGGCAPLLGPGKKDSLVMCAGDLVLFEDMDPEDALGVGWIVSDLSSGTFESNSGAGVPVPRLGEGSQFLAEVELEDDSEFFVGQVSSLLNADWRNSLAKLEVPKIPGYVNVGKFGERGFWIGSSVQSSPIHVFDWSNRLIASFSTDGYVEGGFDRMALAPWAGSDEGVVLFGKRKGKGERVAVVCDRLVDPTAVEVVEAPGLFSASPLVVGKHFVWCAEVEGGAIVYGFKPGDSKAKVLVERESATWLCGGDGRIFYGDKGRPRSQVVCAELS